MQLFLIVKCYAQVSQISKSLEKIHLTFATEVMFAHEAPFIKAKKLVGNLDSFRRRQTLESVLE
jgi:hypothetical protein